MAREMQVRIKQTGYGPRDASENQNIKFNIFYILFNIFYILFNIFYILFYLFYILFHLIYLCYIILIIFPVFFR